ncbi:NAD-dependent histone deacetylase SIR2 [Candida albicans GC75]|nr:NAD-dependent histone deacetylase SIR2 [Candida albicans GC75]
MPGDNDIVLVDSSSDNEEEREEDDDDESQHREIKKFKPNPNPSQTRDMNESHVINKSNFSTVPFNAVSSSSSSDNDQDNDEEEEEEEEEEEKEEEESEINGNQISLSIDDEYDSEGLTKESSRTPIGSNTSDIIINGVTIITNNNDSSLVASSSDDDDDDDDDDDKDDDNDDDASDLESDFAFEEISPSLIMETRKYLKQNGTMKFLEKYLPTAASIENIIKLILQLGFVPKRKLNNGLDENDIMEYIKILNHAIIKVKSIRERREDITTINDVLKLIENSKNIMVITGAGISTSLGIPDFRSSQGFYSMIQHLGLSDPQEVFDLDLFLNDPNIFYSIAHMILPPNQIYSPLHSFIKLLQDKNKLLRNYTQNIDNLESYAGIHKENLIQCHGSFATASCITCGYKVDGEIIFPEIKNKEIPYCPKCNEVKQSILKKEKNTKSKSKKKKKKKNKPYDDDDEEEEEGETYFHESFGVMKPDITFFGEQLPENFKIAINQDINKVDLVLVIGTSLKVAPVADIVGKIPEHIPQILLNKDPINHCQFDVSLLGYCDDVASYIANELGESWDLPHPDYNKIRGEKNGENLSVQLLDSTLREYLISNKKNDLSSEQEQNKMGEENRKVEESGRRPNESGGKSG